MFLYLLAVSGVLIHTHYCGKQLESWQVYVKSDDGCKDDVCTDDPDMENGCCKDETIVAKVNTDQNIVSFFTIKLTAFDWDVPPVPQQYFAQKAIEFIGEKPVTGRPNAPPGLWQNIPLFKLHSRFTYYG